MTNEAPRAKTTVKSLHILEELLDRNGATLADLADDLDMSKSTVHTHLHTLVDTEYVRKDESEYHLGLKSLKLGGYARNQMDLYRSAKHELEQLAADLEAIVQLSCHENYQEVVLLQLGRDSINQCRPTGERSPLVEHVGGQVILAHRDEEYLDTALEVEGERGTLEDGDSEALYKDIEQIRKRGYAQETDRKGTLSRIAVPIHGDKKVVLGALTVILRKRRSENQESSEDTLYRIQSTVDHIEANLGAWQTNPIVSSKHTWNR